MATRASRRMPPDQALATASQEAGGGGAVRP
jgi:hypothetical protein